MEEWRNGGMRGVEEPRRRGMEESRSGGVEESRNGGVEELKNVEYQCHGCAE